MHHCSKPVNVPFLEDNHTIYEFQLFYTGFFLSIAPEFLPKDCNDIRELGGGVDGLYTIYPAYVDSCEGIRVFCDQSTEGGGWTVNY